MVFVPVLLAIKSNPYTINYVLALSFYIIAKILELTDKQIYTLTQYRVSGHTLKHLSASIGMAMLVTSFN
jgi:hypothetical protein